MAFGFDIDSLIAKLGESPVVAKAMTEFTEVRNGIIQTVIHFDTRLNNIEMKLDRIISLLENPPDKVAPAAEHSIDSVLQLEGGEVMEVKDCVVEGCFNQAIHDHGEGPVASKATQNPH